MTQGPSPSLLAAVASRQKTPGAPPDRLAMLQALGAEARDVELEISSMEEAVKRKRERLNQLCQKEMVDLMTELGLDKIGVSGRGNEPARDYRLVPYYSANIAASWPPERREAGFKFITKMGAEALIKTEVSVLFPKGGLKAAQKLAKSAKKLSVPIVGKSKKKIKQPVSVELIKAVPSGSLKSWLKEYYERGRSLSISDLEKIGASVGRIVKPEERKE